MEAQRRRLPATRNGRTHKVAISDANGAGDFELYVTTSDYDDGEIGGEMFLQVGKEGSTLQGLLDSWAIMFSLARQHGTPIDAIVEKFSNQTFAPAGDTSNPEIPRCSSLLDYVARYLGSLVRR